MEGHPNPTQRPLSSWEASSFHFIDSLLAGGKTVFPLGLCVYGGDSYSPPSHNARTMMFRARISRLCSGFPLMLRCTHPAHNTLDSVGLEQETRLSGFSCILQSALPVSVNETPVSSSQWDPESTVIVRVPQSPNA